MACCVWSSSSLAQEAYSTLTVSSTAVALPAAVTTIQGQAAQSCFMVLESQNIRYTVDGTTPTTTVGVLMQSGENIRLEGPGLVSRFRAIRDDAADGTLEIVCSRTLSSPIEQASGGSGAGSSTITDIEDGAGDTVMDAANDAIQVNCVTGCTPGSTFADDGDFVVGTTAFNIVGGLYDSAPTNCNDGDACAVLISQDRRMLVDADITASVALDVSAATVTVDLAGNNDVTIESGAVLATDGSAGPANSLSVAGTDGAGAAQELTTDTDGHLQIDVLSAPTTTVTATNLDVQIGGSDTVTVALDGNTVTGTDGSAGPANTVSIAGTNAGNLEEVNVDSDGHIQVDVLSGGGGGTADGIDFAIGSTMMNIAGALYDDVTPTPEVEDDAGALRMSAERSLYTEIRDAAGNERGVNVTASNEMSVLPANVFAVDVAHAGGSTGVVGGIHDAALGGLTEAEGDVVPLRVDGNGALWTAVNLFPDNEPFDAAQWGGVGVSAAAALADNMANPTAPLIGAAIMTWDGATWDRAQLASDQTEDAVHTTGDTGPMTLAVRNDVLAALAGADGDYAPLQVNATGALYVECDSGCAGGTQHAEDAASADAHLGTAAYAIRQDTLSNLTNADLDYTPIKTDAVGALWVTPRFDPVFGTGVPHASGSVSVSGAIHDTTLSALADAQGDAIPLRVNNNGALWAAMDGTVTVDLGANNDVHGTVAHDAADSGNPLKIGALAQTGVNASVADNDRVDLVANKTGELVVEPMGQREVKVTNRISLTTTTETTLLTAGAAGIYHDLVHLSCSNESATEVRVDIRDDTAGTVRFSFDLAPDGGGFVTNFTTPWPQTAAADNWTAQLSGTVSTVYCHALAVNDR